MESRSYLHQGLLKIILRFLVLLQLQGYEEGATQMDLGRKTAGVFNAPQEAVLGQVSCAHGRKQSCLSQIVLV